jgi:hypothetical protein
VGCLIPHFMQLTEPVNGSIKAQLLHFTGKNLTRPIP